MTSDRSSKSHATTWTITLIVALPLLYLLSVEPIRDQCVRVLSRDAFSEQTITPEWFEWYRMPYVWIHQNTPLRGPLDAYTRLYREIRWG